MTASIARPAEVPGAVIEQLRADAGGIQAEVVPHFDLTVSAVKSVSVLHASYRVAAMRA
jgi:hypothetical protein